MENKTRLLHELAVQNRGIYDDLSLKGEMWRKEEKFETYFERMW